jgi:hypothetical protein
MAEEQYVTYDKYRADLADFRSDMARFREEIRTEITNFRAEIKTDIVNLRTEMKTDIANVRVEMHNLHNKTIIWLFGIVTAAVLALKLIP